MLPLNENAWDAWTPRQLKSRLHGTVTPWYIVGGWAIDLFLERQTRSHDDLEFAVLPKGAVEIASLLSDLTFFTAKNGQLFHRAKAEPPAEGEWQHWGADMTEGFWRVDLMFERGSDELWSYKRAPEITMPRKEAIRISEDGIPYLAPANILLFKVKNTRAKDDDDFHAVLPHLARKDKDALGGWLHALHPGHKWLGYLK